MKAAVLYETGGDLIIKDNIEIPDLKSGQVLVKISYSGICHSQINEIRGFRGEDKYLPHMLGHEATGVVVETGTKVKKVKPGDKVVLSWIRGKGLDDGGSLYKAGEHIINAGGITTFSDYTVVSENRCVKLPEGIPMDEAVLLGCALPTGAGILINEIKPEQNKTIAIFGMGGIGISALMTTKLYSFKKVIAVDIEDRKLALAKDLGADFVINSINSNAVDEIQKLTENLGVDYSIDAAGLSKTIEQAFASVKNKGGLCVFASHPKEGDKISLDPYHLICGKQIRGSWGGGCDPDKFIDDFGSLYNQGLFPLRKLLSKTYALEEINIAIKDIENRKIERALIKLDQNI